MRIGLLLGWIFLAAACAGKAGAPPATGAAEGGADMVPHRPAGDGPWPVALILPGGHGAAQVGKAWPHYHLYAERLAAKGILAVVADYARADRGLVDERRVAELGALLDRSRRLPGAKADRTVVIGFSMGGAYALMLAAARPDLSGVVTFFSPVEFSSGPAAAGKQPLAYVPSIHCPVLVLQGDADKVTSPEQAERLVSAVRAAGGVARLEMFPGQGHGFTYVRAPRGACCNFDEAATARSVGLVADFVAGLGAPGGGGGQ